MAAVSRRAHITLLAIAACSPSAPVAHVAAKAKPSASPSASAAPVAPVSEVDAGPPEDLLWITASRVAVSSRVRNPRDLPEHLVDHKPGTAWNGRTDDLVGGWISFRVPKDARVSHVLLTVGFDKVSSKNGEDLFTANYRIKRVRVLHDDAILREVDLDPSVRAPQRIDIAGSGGTYRIEVLAVEPGAHAGWRELVVSELAVMGTPGKYSYKPRAPTVNIGNLDEDDPAPLATAADVAHACSALVGDHAAEMDQAKTEGMIASDVEIDPATCTAGPALAKTADAEATAADVLVARPFAYNVTFEGKLLVLRDKRGVHLMNVRIGGRETAMQWSISYDLLKSEWLTTPSGPVFAVQVAHRRSTDSDGYFPPGHENEAHSEEAKLVAYACRVTTGAPTCTTASSVVSSDSMNATVKPVATRLEAGAVVFDLPKR